MYVASHWVWILQFRWPLEKLLGLWFRKWILRLRLLYLLACWRCVNPVLDSGGCRTLFGLDGIHFSFVLVIDRFGIRTCLVRPFSFKCDKDRTLVVWTWQGRYAACILGETVGKEGLLHCQIRSARCGVIRLFKVWWVPFAIATVVAVRSFNLKLLHWCDQPGVCYQTYSFRRRGAFLVQ